MLKQTDVMIVGGGIVGNLIAMNMAKKGHDIKIFQRHQDPRIKRLPQGKSINLGLAERGLRALQSISMKQSIIKSSVPMYYRIFHNSDGKEIRIPYGRNGETVYSIKREQIHLELMNQADKYKNIRTQFNRMCVDVDLQNTAVKFINPSTKKESIVKSDIILGCDGHFSKVRLALQTKSNFNMSQMYIEHGYKQITIVADKNGKHQLYPNALHIWLRKSFMVSAFPNLDGTFSCTLLLDKIGQDSYQTLKDQNSIIKFFQKYIPELIPLMPNLVENILTHPLCNMGVISCGPWNYGGKICLLGDSAHAMLPYLGLSLNCGLQDCFVFNNLLEKQDSWEKLFETFFKERKQNSDSIAQMINDNYNQIRFKQNDKKFILSKSIESKIYSQSSTYLPVLSFANCYPQYSFKELYNLQKLRIFILNKLAQINNVFDKWDTLQVSSLTKVIDRYNQKNTQFLMPKL